jgi:hypothetical protein
MSEDINNLLGIGPKGAPGPECRLAAFVPGHRTQMLISGQLRDIS